MAGGNVKDVFGYKRSPNPDGVFSTEESLLTFGGADMSKQIGTLVQQWSVTYRQQVQEIFEIGSSAIFWMKGRPQGEGTLVRIIGDKAADSPGNPTLFPAKAYDLCDGGVLMEIKATSGACGNTGPSASGSAKGFSASGKAKEVAIRLGGCVITSLGFSVQVQDTLINENVQFRFGVMEVDGSGAP
jgi:hypothetical protein